MSDRFYVESPIIGDSALLTGQEAHHVTHVLRAHVGEMIRLFDGTGFDYQAQIKEIRRSEVCCTILGREKHDRELPGNLALGVALPKGDRQRTLIEKLTELGVHSITPIVCERSVVQPDEQSAARLKRNIVEASKQCGRTRLMAIHPPCNLSDFLAKAPQDTVKLFAHPRTASHSSWFTARELLTLPCASAMVAIGPEGGFTGKELQRALDAAWTVVDLGPRLLRVETAAIALAAICGLLIQQNEITERGSLDE